MRRRERLRAYSTGVLFGLLAGDLGTVGHRIAGLTALAVWGCAEWAEWRERRSS
jgi:hypothetical protein